MKMSLKCWPESFDAIARGEKTADIRNHEDRDFQIGDILELVRWDPVACQPTGGRLAVRVTHLDTVAGSIELFGVRLNSETVPGTLVRLVVLSIHLLYVSE